MKAKLRRKRLKRRLKRIAASVASAALMSAVFLPVMPASHVHASAAPNPGQAPAVASQVVRTPTGFHTVTARVAAPAAKQSSVPRPLADQSNTAPNQSAPAPDTKATAKDSPDASTAKANKEQAKASEEDTNQAKQGAGSGDNDKRKVNAKAKAPADFQDVLHVKATAYAPGAHDNGQWGDLTHMGTTVRPGVIAVDPAVIPLGSRVYIEYPDGTGTYAVAEDTGGAIKGNRIDIAMSSVDKAYDFGIKNVKVYVLA